MELEKDTVSLCKVKSVKQLGTYFVECCQQFNLAWRLRLATGLKSLCLVLLLLLSSKAREDKADTAVYEI